MTAIALWLLATLDAAFAGYREAAGRNALINKKSYYRHAMLRGAFLGQAAVAIAAIFLLISLAISSDRQSLLRDYDHAGTGMLIIYIPYALIIGLAFLVRTLPSVDIRSITSTVIFGPFTLIRPAVAVAGLIYGILATPRAETIILGALVLLMMLSLERVLSIFRQKRTSHGSVVQ